MTQDHADHVRPDHVRDVADRVLKLAEELEASGDVKSSADHLARARATLHAWIDGATGFVTLPAFGRVTVILPGGKQATIHSADLSYALSDPVGDAPPADA